MDALDKEPDLLTVQNEEPEYSYYWAVSTPNHPQSVNRLKLMGYEVAKGKEAAIFGEKGEDGSVRVGEMVLMRTPKGNAERIKNEKIELIRRRITEAEERMETVGAEYNEAVERVGRSTFLIQNNPIAKGGRKSKQSNEEAG